MHERIVHLDLKPDIKLPQEIVQQIYKAERMCQLINAQTDLWQGVTTAPDRITQAWTSAKKLMGFSQSVKSLDKERWKTFALTLSQLQPNSRNYRELVFMIQQIIFGQELEIEVEEDRIHPNIWIENAQVEVYKLLTFIDQNWDCDEKVLDFDQEGLNTAASQMSTDFLKMHVGENTHWVKRHDGEGFHGKHKTCPISVLPNTGIKYFAYVAAEYLLMREVGANYLDFISAQS